MTYRRLALPLFVLIAALLSVTITTAQTGGGYDLTWNTIDGGGGTSVGSGYSLDMTLGQADAGVQSGGDYTLIGGFWSGATISIALGDYRVYLPVLLR